MYISEIRFTKHGRRSIIEGELGSCRWKARRSAASAPTPFSRPSPSPPSWSDPTAPPPPATANATTGRAAGAVAAVACFPAAPCSRAASAASARWTPSSSAAASYSPAPRTTGSPPCCSSPPASPRRPPSPWCDERSEAVQHVLITSKGGSAQCRQWWRPWWLWCDRISIKRPNCVIGLRIGY